MNRIDWTAFGQHFSGMLGNNKATDDVMNPEYTMRPATGDHYG
jgi:hypothetical protein